MESEKPRPPKPGGLADIIWRLVDRVRSFVVVATEDRPTLNDQLRAMGRPTATTRLTTAEEANKYSSGNPFREGK